MTQRTQLQAARRPRSWHRGLGGLGGQAGAWAVREGLLTVQQQEEGHIRVAVHIEGIQPAATATGVMQQPKQVVSAVNRCWQGSCKLLKCVESVRADGKTGVRTALCCSTGL